MQDRQHRKDWPHGLQVWPEVPYQPRKRDRDKSPTKTKLRKDFNFPPLAVLQNVVIIILVVAETNSLCRIRSAAK